jgi:hypothetical protein
MAKKWFVLLLVNMVAILLIKQALAAEAFKTTEDQTGFTFIQTYDRNPYPLKRMESHWDTKRISYGLDQNPASGEIDFPIDLPVPLKIDSSVQDALDEAGLSRLAPKWEEKNIYPTFGIKYSFSRFELGDFAKSLVSLFKNMNQDSPRKAHRGHSPVSFYLAFPEY